MKAMKNLLIVFILCAKINPAFTQDSTDYYIKNLCWESLFLKTTYATEFVLTKDAQKLVSAKDGRTVKKLISEISNENKTVVIHVILSKMFEPQNSNIDGQAIYQSDTAVVINYSCNTLRWQYNIKEKKYSIEREEIIKIKEYWEKKFTLSKENADAKPPSKFKNLAVSKRKA